MHDNYNERSLGFLPGASSARPPFSVQPPCAETYRAAIRTLLRAMSPPGVIFSPGRRPAVMGRLQTADHIRRASNGAGKAGCHGSLRQGTDRGVPRVQSGRCRCPDLHARQGGDFFSPAATYRSPVVSGRLLPLVLRMARLQKARFGADVVQQIRRGRPCNRWPHLAIKRSC